MKKIRVSKATPIQLDWLVHTLAYNLDPEADARVDKPLVVVKRGEPEVWFSGDTFPYHERHGQVPYAFVDGMPVTLSGSPASTCVLDWDDRSCTNGHAIMGRIMERERIIFSFYDSHPVDADDVVHARLSRARLKPDGTANWYAPQRGATILIAVARCWVASKLGEEVEVPEELT